MSSFFLSSVLLAGLGMIIAACAPSSSSSATPVTNALASPTAPVTPTPAVTAVPQVTIKTSDHQLGKILTDGSGRTLYVFTQDQANVSNCINNCLQTWPPLRTLGEPQMDPESIRDERSRQQRLGFPNEQTIDKFLGTIQRLDGSTQVTFNSKPLYYYATDERPGDAKGQDVVGRWFVISPGASRPGLDQGWVIGEAITTIP